MKARKKSHFLEKYADIFGWYGATAVLGAYLLVSFAILHPRSLEYQLLNLTGSIGLGTVCYFRRTYQPLFVNIIWGLIAIFAIINILLFIQ